MTGSLTKRRLLVALAGSLLLHALLIAGWLRPAPRVAQVAQADARVSFEPVAAEPRHATRVVVVGPRRSGRGAAPAGRDPSRLGTPPRARRSTPAASEAGGVGGSSPPRVTAEVAPAVVAPAVVAPAVVAPAVVAQQAFERLARTQLLALSKGKGGGLAGFGPGDAATGIGLGTELSGRQLAGSPVTSAPVVLEARPVECELPATLRLRAAIHVLVTRDGAPAVPRLLRSSGHAGFDLCAMRYVGAMRFSPGVDARGLPLDVWMDVEVKPVADARVGSASSTAASGRD